MPLLAMKTDTMQITNKAAMAQTPTPPLHLCCAQVAFALFPAMTLPDGHPLESADSSTPEQTAWKEICY